MGVSKLKIPKICEYCGKSFNAKTVITRFCSKECGHKADNERQKAGRKEAKQQKMIAKIPNNRPYISISEAVLLFGISKDTIRRLIKAGKIPAVNLGQRLTRISRSHIETMFTVVDSQKEKPKEQQPVKLQYEPNECYTINEVSKKYGVSLSTVERIIRRGSIPKRQVGKFIYVPKIMIDKLLAKKMI